MNYIYIFAGHWMNKMCHEPCQTSDDGLLLCGERDGLHIVQEPVVLDEAITFGGWHSFQFTHHGFHTLPKLNFTCQFMLQRTKLVILVVTKLQRELIQIGMNIFCT
jgi:hypothetical protein